MTKITTDFVGNETTAVTKQRLSDILAYWGASTAAYTTWGQARTAMNALLTSTTAGTIGSTELAGSFLPKINFLNDPDEMIADALFGAGEQGVWFDPSDVANLAWRRNLLLQSEAFDSAVWTKNGGATIATTASSGPLGTGLAQKLQEATTTLSFSISASVALSPSTPHTLSVYMKAAERNFGILNLYTGAASCWTWFNLSSGTVGTVGSGATASILSVGGGWYRCSISIATAATGAPNIGVWPSISDGTISYAGTAGNGILIWGAQLELGSTATEYQRITDVNTEVIERFPNATMYQDAAGTIPVTTPGQPIGLRLDKSKGLVLGPEEVTNGNNEAALFSTATGPTATRGTLARSTDLSVTSAKFTGTVSGPAYINPYASTTVPAGKAIKITYRVYIPTAWIGSGIRPVDTSDGSYNPPPVATRDQWVSVSYIRAAKATAWLFSIGDPNANDHTGQSFYIDDLSLRELPGNHATQSTLGSRLTYGIEPKGGRRNLLTWTEDQTNASWVRLGVVPTADQGAGPIFGSFADRLLATSSVRAIYQNATIVVGQSYTLSAYVKRNAATNQGFALFGDNGTPTSPDLIATDAWQRFQYTFTATVTTGLLGFTDNSSSQDYDILVWGAQLELGSTATNYQRVTTAFDVTEAGVNTCHYCQYDGSDDGMVTNSIDFTGTDKMSVFAGVRKSNTTLGIIAELSVDNSSNNGSVALLTQNSTFYQYSFGSRGTILSSAFTNDSAYAAPVSNVLTGTGDISGNVVRLRANGTQVAQATSGQGTGNYGNYPLYLGRRAGSSLAFNGRDYGIIAVGKLANATAIATTEMWLANKTAGVTL